MEASGWVRKLPFPGRTLSTTVRQLVVTSDSPPHVWSLDKLDGGIHWSFSNPLGATRGPTLWNNVLALFPNATALQALNPETGETLWQLGPPFPPGAEETHSYRTTGSRQVLTRPLRTGNELICLRGDGAVIRVTLDRQAQTIARIVSPLPQDVFYSRPTALKDSLWACSRRGYLVELAMPSGNQLQSQQLRASAPDVTGHLGITADLITLKNRIVAASEEGTVFGIKPGAAADAGSPQESWTLPLGKGDDTFARSGELLLSPLRAGTEQCLLATQHDLRCIGAERGDLRWRRRLPQGLCRRPYCVTEQERVYVATEDSILLELSLKDGSTRRTWRLPAQASATPLVDGQFVYVATGDGSVSCLSIKDH